jgi:AraC-like DNA-binding protein
MEEHRLHIKNMVCPRCTMAVENTLNALNIPFHQVELGEVLLKEALSSRDHNLLKEQLGSLGFELLEKGKSALISRIKTLLIQQIHHEKEALNINFSVFLAEKLNYEYSYLSRLFSSVEGITIEKFITQQKIEKVKELLFYNELSLAEIAFQLNYSSAAYLSTQFKKETGMTPSQFKKNRHPSRWEIDQI